METDLQEILFPFFLGGGQLWAIVVFVALGRLLQLGSVFYVIVLLPVAALSAVVSNFVFGLDVFSYLDGVVFEIVMLTAFFFAAPLAMTLIWLHIRKLRARGIDIVGVFQ